MHPSAFVSGLGIGFVIAAPIGPMGLLCIRRTLGGGRANGIATGLGIATVHTLYGGISGLGLAAVATFLADYRGWVRPLGGLILCLLGLRILLARPAIAAVASLRGLLGSYTSALALALANPLTLLSFAAFAAASGNAGGSSYAAVGLLALGVGLGSTAWWCLLSGAISLGRGHLTARAIRWLNRLSGGGIAAFGVLLLLRPLG